MNDQHHDFKKEYEFVSYNSVTSITVEPHNYREGALKRLVRDVKALLEKYPLDYKVRPVEEFLLLIGDDAYEAVCLGSFLPELERLCKITEVRIEALFMPEKG